MGSLWTVELDVDRSRASPMFCGLARGEVRRVGVGVEESRSCELTDWALLRHGEEPVEGDAIVAVVVLSHEPGGPETHHPSNGALAMSKNYVSDGNMMQSGGAAHWYFVVSRHRAWHRSSLRGSVIYTTGSGRTEHSSQDDGIHAAASPTAAIVAMALGKERATDGQNGRGKKREAGIADAIPW